VSPLHACSDETGGAGPPPEEHEIERGIRVLADEYHRIETRAG
jgi:hypothetical protein